MTRLKDQLRLTDGRISSAEVVKTTAMEKGRRNITTLDKKKKKKETIERKKEKKKRVAGNF